MEAIEAVIVTHNNAATIGACLDSLKAAGVCARVVDNASSDATCGLVEKKKVAIIKNRANKGFAAAANQGVRAALSRYVFLLNPDAVLQQGDIGAAVGYLDAHASIAIAGIELRDKNGALERHGFGESVTPLSLILRKVGKGNRSHPPCPAGWVSGGGMIVRKSSFDALGGFDEGFFLYWEDIDLCRRAREKGGGVEVIPWMRAMHSRGESLQDKAKKTAIYDKSADRYFRKHYSKGVWIAQRLLRRIYRFYCRQVY